MPCGAWGARRRATVPKCSGNRGLHSCPAYHRERSRIGRPHQNRTTRYDERIGNDGGKEPAPSTRPAASQRTSQRSHYHPTEDQRREDHSPLCGGALGSEQEQRSRRYEGQPEKQAVLASLWNEPPPGAINVTAQIAKAAVTSPQPANVGRHICPPQTRSRTGKYHPPSSMAWGVKSARTRNAGTYARREASRRRSVNAIVSRRNLIGMSGTRVPV